MSWYERIIAAHRAVTDAVSHAGRLKSRRYFVWQEGAPNDLIADGRHVERAHTGKTDLFTAQEFDPWAEQLEAAFDANGIAWAKAGCWPDEGDGTLWHHSWDWEVAGDG